jgi:excisionase family DNA binding protein
VRVAEKPSASAGTLAEMRLLTLEEVAGFLAVSERTVRRLVAARRLRCVRLGRVLRFQQAELFRFVEGKE